MDSSTSRHQRRNSFRQPLDRRVDNWIQTGRQVVDGVAGTRPGKRKVNSNRFSNSNLDKVGRWVGDKLDWFLEDEDSWLEPWQTTDSQARTLGNKRPLDAISMRGSKMNSTQRSMEPFDQDDWPEESSFRVERWRRDDIDESPDQIDKSDKRREFSRPEIRRESTRPLPRSSRRRY